MIFAELRLLEVVFVAADLLSVGEGLSFEAFESVDCREAPPSAGTFRVVPTSCRGHAEMLSSAEARQLVMIWMDALAARTD